MYLLEYAELLFGLVQVDSVLHGHFVVLVHTNQAFNNVSCFESVRLMVIVRRVEINRVRVKIVNFAN